jgi:hypothetical protein
MVMVLIDANFTQTNMIQEETFFRTPNIADTKKAIVDKKDPC